jgi:hypothetical protein
MKDSDLIVPDSLFKQRGSLKIKRLVYKAVEYTSDGHGEKPLQASKRETAHQKIN